MEYTDDNVHILHAGDTHLDLNATEWASKARQEAVSHGEAILSNGNRGFDYYETYQIPGHTVLVPLREGQGSVRVRDIGDEIVYGTPRTRTRRDLSNRTPMAK